jgi:hypothetical protein
MLCPELNQDWALLHKVDSPSFRSINFVELGWRIGWATTAAGPVVYIGHHGVWPMNFNSLIPRTSSVVSKSQSPWSILPWWGNFYEIGEKSYKTTIYHDKI